ncbi:hypothetical protein [Streptomyces sp. NBC_00878]|uniref:hypothetical protein n=1 Tax=Streptomyces sp. NBC_00878 TaxID=2975854 RepID=UPI00225C2164|nr:hypothetical protein [Streptomyces sp. NBC_00878]MCX4908272.1 hypothetical protein [Streptomyces sp. NBC_00878]
MRRMMSIAAITLTAGVLTTSCGLLDRSGGAWEVEMKVTGDKVESISYSLPDTSREGGKAEPSVESKPTLPWKILRVGEHGEAVLTVVPAKDGTATCEILVEGKKTEQKGKPGQKVTCTAKLED